MADVAVLEQKAIRLKEQAAALHRADTEAVAHKYGQVGRQRDAMKQQLDAAREAAKAATDQARQQHEKAQEFEAEAVRLEQEAKDPDLVLIRADESRLETAQKMRALASAASERAAENHRAVAKHTAETQRLEQQLTDLPAQIDLESSPIEKLADQLDDMVDRLSHAASNQREAMRLEAAGQPAAAEAMRDQANRELEHLSNIRPDFTSVEPAVLRQAGITPADVELVDPRILPDTPATTPSPTPTTPMSPTPTPLAPVVPGASSDAGDVLGADTVVAASASEDGSEETAAADTVSSNGDDAATTVAASSDAAGFDSAANPVSEAATAADGGDLSLDLGNEAAALDGGAPSPDLLSEAPALADDGASLDDFADPGIEASSEDAMAPADDMNDAIG